MAKINLTYKEDPEVLDAITRIADDEDRSIGYIMRLLTRALVQSMCEGNRIRVEKPSTARQINLLLNPRFEQQLDKLAPKSTQE